MPQELLWLNGRIMDPAEGTVGVEDRALNFADGIYEVIRFYNGQPFMLAEHLDRWEHSAAGILLDSPGTRGERAARILDLAGRSGFGDCTVYGQLTRGQARRRHTFPDPGEAQPNEFWIVRPAPVYPPASREQGVALSLQPDERWAHCHYKTTALLPNCLAKERARRAGAFEAVLARDGVVTEASATNLFAVLDGVVRTHPLDNRILPGITRIALLRAARATGIPVVETAFTVDEMMGAEELFLTSTTMEVMPASRVDGHAIGTGRPGPVTRRLAAAVRDLVAASCGGQEALSA